MKRTIALVAFLFAAFSLFGGGPAAGPQTDPVVRVLVLDDQPAVTVSVSGPYRVTSAGTGSAMIQVAGAETTVAAQPGKVTFGPGTPSVTSVRIHAIDSDDEITVGKIRFRGDIEVRRKPDGTFMVVNHVGVEEYLYGVLSHEISHRWPAEAIKAQAIASRTFALYQARANEKQPYDLRNDIYSQVYGGKNYEKLPTTQAVEATAGEVLTYNGDIFPTYFHATCGGATEKASNLWNIDLPPLGGSPCGFCGDSKHYRWHETIPLEKLGEVMRRNGYRIGTVGNVRVVLRNGSGRVDRLAVQDDTGTTLLVTGKDFRQMFGPNVVRSTNFTVTMKGDAFLLDGRGWGHGVGMCQWGARGMAEAGWKADRILQRYYPGAVIAADDTIISSR